MSAQAGGPVSVSVAIKAGCRWTASVSDTWVLISGEASGTGNGTVSLVAEANALSTPRDAVLTIAGRHVTLTQSGASDLGDRLLPGQRLYPGQWLTSANGYFQFKNQTSEGSLFVAGRTSIKWTSPVFYPTGYVEMLTDGRLVHYADGGVARVISNDETTHPGARVVMQGDGHLVLYAADGQTALWGSNNWCSYTPSPLAFESPAAGDTRTIAVTTQTDCPWEASSPASWATVAHQDDGGGFTLNSGPATVNIAENTSSTARPVTLTIAEQSVTVTQHGKPGSIGSDRLLSGQQLSAQSVHQSGGYRLTLVGGNSGLLLFSDPFGAGTVARRWHGIRSPRTDAGRRSSSGSGSERRYRLGVRVRRSRRVQS